MSYLISYLDEIVMWIQQGRNWPKLGKIEFPVDLNNVDKYTT